MGEGDCTARRLLDGVEDQPRTIEADRLRPGPHAQRRSRTDGSGHRSGPIRTGFRLKRTPRSSPGVGGALVHQGPEKEATYVNLGG